MRFLTYDFLAYLWNGKVLIKYPCWITILSNKQKAPANKYLGKAAALDLHRGIAFPVPMHKGLHPLYSRPNKLTSPRLKLCQFLRFYKTVHRTILQKEKPTHDRFTLNTSVSSSDLDGHIQLSNIVLL